MNVDPLVRGSQGKYHRENWLESLRTRSNNSPYNVTSLAKAKKLTGKDGDIIYLLGRSSIGDGYEGQFYWNSSDLSTEVTADTQNGIYIPPDSDTTGASGAWVRVFYEYMADWFGTDSAGINAAITLVAIDGGELHFDPKTTYSGSSSLIWQPGVSIKGHGATFTYSGSSGGALITNDTYGAPVRDEIDDLIIDASSNANSIDVVDLRAGANQCEFKLRIEANSSNSSGFRLRGYNPDTALANNRQYNNKLTKVTVTGGPDVGIWLNGSDVTNARCNSNVLRKCQADGCTTANFRINGNGNVLISPTINAATSGVYFEGDEGNGNTIIAPYFDGGIAGDIVTIANPASITSAVVSIFGGIGYSASEITDNNPPTTGKRFLYVGGDQYSGDVAFIGKYIELVTSTSLSDRSIRGDASTGVLIQQAYNNNTSARLLLAASGYSGGVNAVSDDGGASVSIADSANAEHRVVKTANGSSYTVLTTVDSSGNLILNAGDLILPNSNPPASASAAGTAGTVAWDSSYIYVCIATNTWVRAAIATW